MPRLDLKVHEDRITWGDQEIFMRWADMDMDDASDEEKQEIQQEIVSFFNRVLEDGASSVPLVYTEDAFRAIFESVGQAVEATQKNSRPA